MTCRGRNCHGYCQKRPSKVTHCHLLLLSRQEPLVNLRYLKTFVEPRAASIVFTPVVWAAQLPTRRKASNIQLSDYLFSQVISAPSAPGRSS